MYFCITWNPKQPETRPKWCFPKYHLLCRDSSQRTMATIPAAPSPSFAVSLHLQGDYILDPQKLPRKKREASQLTTIYTYIFIYVYLFIKFYMKYEYIIDHKSI